MSIWFRYVSIVVILVFAQMSHSETITSIEVHGLSFISSDFDNPDKNSFGFIGASLRSNEKSPDLFMVSATGMYAVGNSNLSYLNLREGYFLIQYSKDTKYFLGRKVMKWSALDSQFNLGLFQHQFRWNTLDPQNQGLTGLFWDQQKENWGLTLFASHLFIPDQGPSYEIKEGQFTETNPWFHNPPQNIQIQGQQLPIDYTIQTPETQDVVLRPLLAIQLRLGAEKGLFGTVSASYKPSNQLALGYTSAVIAPRVKINVVPKVYNETLVSADFGYHQEWGFAQLSVIHAKPQTPTFENSATTPILNESTTWGPSFLYHFKPFQFGIAVMDTSGGEVTEVGIDASPDRPSLTQRFLYRQAVQIQLKYSEIFLKQLKLESQLRYTTSQSDGFTQINFYNRFNIKGPWAFWSDVILIETLDDASLNMNSSRNLDQFWIGASYDF